MEKITKVEIIIEQVQLPLILNLLKQLNISGYTLIKDVIGSGLHGEYDGQELSELMKNSYLIILIPQEKAEVLVQQANSILIKIGGVIMSSTTNWIHY